MRAQSEQVRGGWAVRALAFSASGAHLAAWIQSLWKRRAGTILTMTVVGKSGDGAAAAAAGSTATPLPRKVIPSRKASPFLSQSQPLSQSHPLSRVRLGGQCAGVSRAGVHSG